ncbi:MAG: hypothetical protein AB8B53_02630 [Flavobacteriales bacterium]
MRLVYSILFLTCCNAFYAQQELQFSFEPITEKYSVLELEVEGDIYSDVVENSLTDRLLFGGGIDREDLLGMSENMDGSNLIGGWADARMRYRALTDPKVLKRPYSLMLEFGTASYGYSRFSKDVFHLGFLGNADRLGETLFGSNTVAETMLYQYAGLGIMNESTGSYASFNLINVQNYFRSEVTDLELFTAEDVSQIDLIYNGEVVLNDSLRGDFLSNSGTGAVLNARYNIQLREKKDLFSVELRNVGFSRLNDRARVLSSDSSFSFSGVNITEVLSSDNPLESLTLEDSIQVVRAQEARTVAMPADLRANYYHSINEADYIAVGVRKRFFSFHNPELSVSYIHQETNKIGYTIGAVFGGYGKLRLNASVNYSHKNWRAFIATRNITGLMLDSAKGKSISFGLARTFNSPE